MSSITTRTIVAKKKSVEIDNHPRRRVRARSHALGRRRSVGIGLCGENLGLGGVELALEEALDVALQATDNGVQVGEAATGLQWSAVNASLVRDGLTSLLAAVLYKMRWHPLGSVRIRVIRRHLGYRHCQKRDCNSGDAWSGNTEIQRQLRSGIGDGLEL